MYKYHFMPEKNVNFEISHTSLFKLIYKKLATDRDSNSLFAPFFTRMLLLLLFPYARGPEPVPNPPTA